MKIQNSMDAVTLTGSSLGTSGGVYEGGNAQGVYHGVCRGYKEDHQAEYLDGFNRLNWMRNWFDQAVRGTILASTKTLHRVNDLIEELEQYLDSLTEIKWDLKAQNTVMTGGKNLALDTFLAGSSYTVTGPFMGLIGAVSYSAISAADAMASHAGWTEGGTTNAPTYTGPRKTISWSAASGGSKSPSAAPVYTFTGSGTVKGVFMAYGAGAVSTIDNTSGTLLSAGLFTGGDQAVVSTNTVTVTYTISL